MDRIIGIYSTYVTNGDMEDFAALAPGFEVRRLPDPLTPEDIEPCEVLLGFIPPQMLTKARHLKWLNAQSAGVAQFSPHGTFPHHDVIVTNSAGAYGTAIAEHIMAMTLMLTRRMPYYMELKREKNWKDWRGETSFASLCGSVVTIVGLGDIGTHFARIAKPFGATIRGVRRTDLQGPDCVDEMYLIDDLDTALAGADIVVLCLPGTDKTAGIMTRERLFAMKEGSFLVNIGRGSLVDEEALIEALKTGPIRGAGLDVTQKEPLPQDSELWTLPNVVLTPHIAGTASAITIRNIMNIFKDNLKRYAAGEPLEHVVNLKEGY